MPRQSPVPRKQVRLGDVVLAGLFGRLMVFDTPLSVWRWNAAWWRTCHSKGSRAQSNTRARLLGTPGDAVQGAARATSCISASE